MDDDPAATTQRHTDPTIQDDAPVENGVWTSASATGGDRSPNDLVCPFLRAVDQNDELGTPIEAPDPANRCAALRDPVPQSLRQQELVCLTSGHVNCPRYLRGTIVTTPAPVPVEVAVVRQTERTVTPAIAGALAVLVVAFMVSLGFVVSTGGLVLTAAPAASGTGGVLAEAESLAPSAAPTPIPTASPSPSPTPSPTPSPSVTPSPSPTPTATPTPTPRPQPTSDRYAVLKPCPGTPNCYLYVIRSGNNLYSIANYFGVSLKTIQAMNPWTSNGIKPGQTLRIPTPTR